MIRAILIICVTTTLIGCATDYTHDKGKIRWYNPKPLFLSNLPEGDDSYSQGIRDGCNNAISIIGTALLRNNDFSYDINQGIEDRNYYRGYRIGYNYCTYYIDSDPL